MREELPTATSHAIGALWDKINVRWVQVGLGCALSVLFLWLAFWNVPVAEVFAVFKGADYRFVALAVGLVLLSPLIRAARWRLLFYPDQQDVSRGRLAEILLIGQMLNIAVPARIGEIARIHFVRQLQGRSRARTLGTIAVEKSLDLVMLFLLVLLVPAFVTLPGWFRDARLSLGVFSATFLALVLVLPRYQTQLTDLVRRVSQPLPGAWSDRVEEGIRRALDTLDVLRNVGINLRLQGWSLLVLLGSVLTNYLVFRALGMALPFAAALFLLAVLQIGIAVPSAPGKLGVFHYLCILALGVFGVERNAAVGYAVLLHVVVFLPPSLLGALFLGWESVRRRRASWATPGTPVDDLPHRTAQKTGWHRDDSEDPVRFSVIVPTHDDHPGLDACLTGLKQQSAARATYEIIVVNDGPAPPHTRATAERHGAVFLTQPRTGAGAARNRGASQARGRILLFTDADCTPSPGWVAAMTTPFSEPGVVGVSGAIRTQQTGIVPRYIQLEYDRRYEAMEGQGRIDFISTAAAAYERRAFAAAGGFDPSLRGAEDAELSFRLAHRGHKLVFAPQAVVYHHHPRSLLRYVRRKAHYGLWRTTIYRRYPGKAVADSRTPQVQKLRMLVGALLWPTLLGMVLWPRLVWVAVPLALIFLAASLPFWIWTLRRDFWVGLLTPFLLLAGDSGAAFGVASEVFGRLLRVFGLARATTIRPGSEAEYGLTAEQHRE